MGTLIMLMTSAALAPRTIGLFRGGPPWLTILKRIMGIGSLVAILYLGLGRTISQTEQIL